MSSGPVDAMTPETVRLMRHADTLGYKVDVMTGDLVGSDTPLPCLVVRLTPRSRAARARFKLAGREDRLIEAVARLHPDKELAPYALESALTEAMRLHNDHLGLVIA